LIDIYYSTLSMKTNDIIRILTVVSTIFIPLTFITGIYGMNFNTRISPYNMPELNWYYGYPATLLTMLIIALGMLYYFKKKGWL
jgi:magnesium transporter